MQISTWQRWLGNFGFGWDFSKQERVLALCLGAAALVPPGWLIWVLSLLLT